MMVFVGVLIAGLIFIGSSIARTSAAQRRPRVALRLVGPALLVALGFEFVNGFHDTANALPP